MKSTKLHSAQNLCQNICLALSSLLMFSCSSGKDSADQNSSTITLAVNNLTSPANDFCAEPNFAVTPNGEVALSWVEKSGDSLSSLKISYLNDNTWTKPKLIASGNDWFVNWADFPAIAIDKQNNILASWLQKSADATYAYDIHLALSSDSATTWTSSFVPHSDKTKTEHGFVSAEALASGGFAVTWLDGRLTGEEGGAMTLRYATVSASGELTDEALLDNRACDCCKTTMTILQDGSALIAYRDRSENEIRDIYIVRGAPGSDGISWSAPKAVHNDNWKIAGCPVNGPALASSDSLVVITWFTLGDDENPKVLCAFSHDFGQSFDKPIRLDSGNPLGRVDAIMLDSHTALISWLEYNNETAQTVIRTVQSNTVQSNGALASPTLSSPTIVIKSNPSRSSGFARLARTNSGAIIAWTNATNTTRIQTAYITIK